ncbi:MAG: hypothetical protein R2694_21005, partial [Ilumatobacteraceae bacterium]
DIPRERVLTAATVASGAPAGTGLTVDADMTVAEIVPMLLATDAPIDVIGADGRAVGSLDRGQVAAMLSADGS